MQEGEITKKELYLLKKQEKEQGRINKERGKRIRKIVLISLPIVLVSAGAIWGIGSYVSGRDQGGNQGAPRIEIKETEYDAGTVSINSGLVSHKYEIKNNGEGNLKIDGIRTSCDCTKAILRVGDKTSPEFGMHNNPVFWSQEIAPNESGYLEVIFDPAFHGPEGTGSMIREAYFSTNDRAAKTAKVRLVVNVVP